MRRASQRLDSRDNALAAWDIPDLSLSESAVLMTVARYGNADGTGSYPSEARIAIKTKQSIKTVRGVLLRLIAKGYISRRHRDVRPTGWHGAWEYTVHMLNLRGDAEEGEERARELVEEEGRKAYARVLKFRGKTRDRSAT